MLGEILRTHTDELVSDGTTEAVKVYRIHERGVSYTSKSRPIGSRKWTKTSTSEIPLPAPLMAMMPPIHLS